MKKKFGTLLMAALTAMALLAGCGGSSEPTVDEAAKDQAIMVVSFGTSYNDSRDITIGAVEEAIAAAFPDYEVRRAFTSDIIMDILEERDPSLTTLSDFDETYLFFTYIENIYRRVEEIVKE